MSTYIGSSPDGEWFYETYEEGEPESDGYEYEYEFVQTPTVVDIKQGNTPVRRCILATNVDKPLVRTHKGKLVRRKRKKE